jgi:predicted acetyltransferase
MNISPFPIKVHLTDFNKTLRFEDIKDEELLEYIKERAPSTYHPLYKVYKMSLTNHWCNMMFGPEHWDFEDEYNEDSVCIKYNVCFRKEEYATMFALRWL